MQVDVRCGFDSHKYAYLHFIAYHIIGVSAFAVNAKIVLFTSYHHNLASRK